jgi:hypothetical protein
VALLTVLLATHFLSLQYLPAIGAGASVRLTRLRSRMDLDFFHFLRYGLNNQQITQE